MRLPEKPHASARVSAFGGSFDELVNLGPPVNSEHSEGDTYVAPDESWDEADAGDVYGVDNAAIQRMRR